MRNSLFLCAIALVFGVADLASAATMGFIRADPPAVSLEIGAPGVGWSSVEPTGVGFVQSIEFDDAYLAGDELSFWWLNDEGGSFVATFAADDFRDNVGLGATPETVLMFDDGFANPAYSTFFDDSGYESGADAIPSYNSVPEPSSFFLLASSALLLLRGRRQASLD